MYTQLTMEEPKMQTIEELLAVHTYLTADDLVCDRCLYVPTGCG